MPEYAWPRDAQGRNLALPSRGAGLGDLRSRREVEALRDGEAFGASTREFPRNFMQFASREQAERLAEMGVTLEDAQAMYGRTAPVWRGQAIEPITDDVLSAIAERELAHWLGGDDRRRGDPGARGARHTPYDVPGGTFAVVEPLLPRGAGNFVPSEPTGGLGLGDDDLGAGSYRRGRR